MGIIRTVRNKGKRDVYSDTPYKTGTNDLPPLVSVEERGRGSYSEHRDRGNLVRDPERRSVSLREGDGERQIQRTVLRSEGKV